MNVPIKFAKPRPARKLNSLNPAPCDSSRFNGTLSHRERTLVEFAVSECIQGLHSANLLLSSDSDIPDLSVMDVQALIAWSEEQMYTCGVVHGERRKAAGIELIFRGIQVLKGKVNTPKDMKSPLRSVLP